MNYYKNPEDNEVWAYEDGEPVKEGLVPITDEERDTLWAQSQERDKQAYMATLVTPETVRQHRDAQLALTDWMANSDVVMSEEMRAYRQALRDVTDQTGFPENVIWPTKP